MSANNNKVLKYISHQKSKKNSYNGNSGSTKEHHQRDKDTKLNKAATNSSLSNGKRKIYRDSPNKLHVKGGQNNLFKNKTKTLLANAFDLGGSNSNSSSSKDKLCFMAEQLRSQDKSSFTSEGTILTKTADKKFSRRDIVCTAMGTDEDYFSDKKDKKKIRKIEIEDFAKLVDCNFFKNSDKNCILTEKVSHYPKNYSNTTKNNNRLGGNVNGFISDNNNNAGNGGDCFNPILTSKSRDLSSTIINTNYGGGCVSGNGSSNYLEENI